MKKILGILIAIVIVVALFLPKLFGPNEVQPRKASVIILSQIQSALLDYKKDCGEFPGEGEGLQALVSAHPSCANKKMHFPYLKKFPTDGWGKSFTYLNDGKTISVSTTDKSGNKIFFDCNITSNQCTNKF